MTLGYPEPPRATQSLVPRWSAPKGKVIKRYRHEDVKTPLECLALLGKRGLVKFKEGIGLAALQAQAKAQTDLAAAQAMQ